MTKTLTLGWLYPDLMSTYGDQGNITVLKKRCEWRNISVEILPIDKLTTNNELEKVDLLFGGGAQDREQKIVINDLHKKKNSVKKIIDNEKPALFVCGSPQLMGQYYEPSIGKRIEGLGIFDMVSKHPGPEDDRLIGNVLATVSNPLQIKGMTIVGFENHGGRTQLGSNALPFAKIIVGNGNNGQDKTEGVVYKNAVGCYFHGPLLPKNPEIADWLIKTALLIKYQKEVTLEKLDDSLEQKAKEAMLKKLKTRG